MQGVVENAHMIHAIHRWLAWGVVLIGFFVAGWVFKRRTSGRQAGTYCFLCALTGQFIPGALTVIWAVPLWTAVAHQVFGFVLVSITGALLHSIVRSK